MARSRRKVSSQRAHLTQGSYHPERSATRRNGFLAKKNSTCGSTSHRMVWNLCAQHVCAWTHGGTLLAVNFTTVTRTWIKHR